MFGIFPVGATLPTECMQPPEASADGGAPGGARHRGPPAGPSLLARRYTPRRQTARAQVCITITTHLYFLGKLASQLERLEIISLL